MRVIIALGNPGDQYKNSRHNAAWLLIDNLLGDVKWSENKKFSALTYEDGDFLFVKPLTFMNESGRSAQSVLNYYKLLPLSFGLIKKKDADLNDCLTIVHDDLDLNFGDYKIATNSGSAGNRGVESIINHLKTKKFTRLRIGIKNELLRTKIPPEKFVLQNFNSDEKEKLYELNTKINIKSLN
jgi:PTH1 family peptidyl-tRNA hydrolase